MLKSNEYLNDTNIRVFHRGLQQESGILIPKEVCPPYYLSWRTTENQAILDSFSILYRQFQFGNAFLSLYFSIHKTILTICTYARMRLINCSDKLQSENSSKQYQVNLKLHLIAQASGYQDSVAKWITW
ncbi:unnamed protein product [Schistosoma guineensis]|nr:unnamed protein product [Schistosoma guineensis]